MTLQLESDLRKELSCKSKEYIIDSYIKFMKTTESHLEDINILISRLDEKVEK